MSEVKRKATYRVIRFPLSKGDRFVAIAWNYAEGVLVAPGDKDTYREARIALIRMCEELNIELYWFDGSYVAESDNMLIPDPIKYSDLFDDNDT